MNTYSPLTPRTPAHKPAARSGLESPSSDYSSELTTSTFRFPDPTTLLSQRWQHISRQISRRRLERNTVVALNRNLDEAENILIWSAPETVQQANKGLGLGIRMDSDRGEHLDCTTEITPPASAEPDAPAPVDLGSRKRLEDEAHSALLGRLSKAVEQLRQRQEEFKVGEPATQQLLYHKRR